MIDSLRITEPIDRYHNFLEDDILLYEWVFCLGVCMYTVWSQKEVPDPLELELPTAISSHMG